jgi:urea transporter
LTTTCQRSPFPRLTLYGVAATGDRGLRRQLAITWGPLPAGAALLIGGGAGWFLARFLHAFVSS